MKTKTADILIGGFIATVVFLFVAFLENLTGFLEINPPTFMVELANGSLWIGLLLHLIVGWIFAALYAVFFVRALAWIRSDWFRGCFYGILMAMAIRIAMAMTNTWVYEGNMSAHIIALIIAYGAFGVVLGLIVKNKPAEV